MPPAVDPVDTDLTKRPTDIDHIARSMLPWRDETDALTECGRPVQEVSVAPVDELRARVKRVGQARAMFTVCLTCVERHDHRGRGETWNTNPVAVIGREVERVRSVYPYALRDETATETRRRAERDRFAAELKAIAALINAHRDEFDGFITGLAATNDLTERRNKRTHQARGQ